MNIEHKILQSSKIHYFVINNDKKQTILFLHPAFANHKTFDNQLEFFYDKFNIITIDLLGHGLSQDIKTNEKIDSSAYHIKQILEIENINAVHLVGVSLGSLIAQDFANKYPKNILSLCVVGAYDINNYDNSIEKQQIKQQLSFIFKALISIKWFSKSNAKITVKTLDAQKKFYKMNCMFKRSSLKYMTGLNNIMNKFTTIDRVYPLLIICGESDNELALLLAKKWHDLELKSLYTIIKNAGHCANMDNPEEFNAVLDNFFKCNKFYL